MICTECGFENGGNAKFCSECGMSLVASKTGESPGQPANPASNPGMNAVVDGSLDPIPATETKPLELPSVFESTGNKAFEAPFAFDFSPIDDDEPSYPNIPYAEGFRSASQDQDADGFDEYLVGSDYVAPQASWKTNTMEMPRVDDKPVERKEYRAPEGEGKRRPGRVIAIVAIVLVVAAAILAGATYQMEVWGGKSLPDVEGLNRAEAIAVLEERGFTVKSMLVKSDDREDIVLLMDPGAGRRLSEGSEVVLQVSTPRVIPEVVGLSMEQAAEAFASEGFERVEYVKEKSDEAENTVLSIDPAAGQTAKASTSITVTVAEPYIVPETAGMDSVSATEAVEAAGFNAEILYVYSEQAEGSVVQSDPVAGTKLASGSTVTIQIAKSRAKELIELTQGYLYHLAEVGSLEIGGTSYEFIASDSSSITYTAANTTTATITVVGVTTLPDGEVVRGSQKQRTVTFVWGDDNSLISYA